MSDSYDFPLTVLDLNEVGVSPYSARGLTQTLEPIAGSASMARTVNGSLMDISAPQFRKYTSQISCNDQLPPALDGVFPGMEMTIHCAAHLSYRTAGGSPNRQVSSGSSRVEGEYTLYRPILVMRVTAFNTQEDEYGATVSWNLSLEEI